MARAHLFRPLTDATGALLLGATVTILDANTGAVVGDNIYTSDSPGTDTLTNPFTADNGYIDLYLDAPRRVQVLVTLAGVTLAVFTDIYPPADQVVTSDTALRIINSPIEGMVLVATEVPGEAIWLAPGGLQPTEPIASPNYPQINGDWSVDYSQLAQAVTINVGIPTGPPWDGSADPGDAYIMLQTFMAQKYDGRGPELIDQRIVDLATISSTYTYNVIVPDAYVLYWVYATGADTSVLFDWRAG